MKKVTYFDVEWSNPTNKSICQMGIMCENFEDDEPLHPELNVYVNPEDNFEDFCISVRGITPNKVKDKPNFKEIWEQVADCFTNSIIIGHNVVGADLDALCKNLYRYNLDIPEMYYVDTLEIAKYYVSDVKSYSMSNLCKHFEIDIDNEHDAFDDACANKELLIALKNKYNFDIDEFVHRFIPKDIKEFEKYLSSPSIRKAISEIYGILQGIIIDKKLNEEELLYLSNWTKNNVTLKENNIIYELFEFIDTLISTKSIAAADFKALNNVMTKYYETLSSAQTTIATQILSGILIGISVDHIVNTEECIELQNWLYDNYYLKGHYPFDKIISILEDVLADNIITKDESDLLIKNITEILNPIKETESTLFSIQEKNICLSGNFDYGQKSKVEDFISKHGGKVVSSVTKKLDMLIVGNSGSELYIQDNYGTKVKKAIELNQKGNNILIIKEKDFFNKIN